MKIANDCSAIDTAREVEFGIVTPSCRTDFERCRLLCESIDLFAARSHTHYLVVEQNDLDLFRALEGKRRMVLCRETIIGDDSVAPACPSGWIMQQLVKLAAHTFCAEKFLLFLDSDICLIRPIGIDHYMQGSKLELFSDTAHNFDGPESKLMRSASRILRRTYERGGYQYIMPAITWHGDVLIQLFVHLEHLWGKGNVWRVLASESDLSEYSLYGEFVDNILKGSPLHFRSSDKSKCHCRWKGDFLSDHELREFISATPSSALAVLIQSNIKVPVWRYETLLKSAFFHAGA